jgi:hypothetical protein
MNKQATIEKFLEAVFPMWSVLKLYNEDTSGVDSHSLVESLQLS